ncbi:cytochrome c [Novosphingobium aquae]|jgi:cytochrome c556|uniref:Cytochrome c n=1 Tax=Novosphingobium aquae TaxID=3133435 RepID=A0ABU8S9K2_9SPHN
MRNSLSAIAILAPLLALSACGNPDTPGGRAADARHENFEALGDAFKTIGDELKAQAPDAQKVRAAAATVAAKAKDMPGWFPAGSGPDAGLKTDAKADVWTKPDEFRTVMTAFQDSSVKLLAAADGFAAGQPVVGLQEAVKQAGGTCKKCHDGFKTD